MSTLRQAQSLLRILIAGALLPIAGEPTLSATTTHEAELFTDQFNLPECRWTATGRNGFFILEPGYQSVYAGTEDGLPTVLEITVLDATRAVDGVETRIVEERETRNGQLVEVSRNYFALCGPGNDTFYFGEDVDTYEGGKLKDHEGSWIAGVRGARPGLFLPARPLLGARFYQEVAPGVAMDRVEIQSNSAKLKAPGGNFEGCVRTEETTPLEPDAKEYKVFAPGVGLVQDGPLLLTKHGPAAKNR